MTSVLTTDSPIFKYQILIHSNAFRCRTNFVTIVIIYIAMAVAVTICNITILIVFFTNKKLQNGQAIFKISLAFSDLLVGLVVFPSMIVNSLSTETWRNEMSSVQNRTRKANNSFPNQILIEKVRSTPVRLCWEFPSFYINAIGFFTVLSIGVSMCTLVAAALDRFMAVYKPLQYQQPAAMKIARRVVVFTWMAMAVFASIPCFINEVRYSRAYVTVVVPEGYAGIVVFSAVFTVLLVLMWIIAIAIVKVYQNHQKITGHLHNSVNSKHEAASQTRNLLVVLGIMVGAFTLSLLPTIIFLPITYLGVHASPDAKLQHFVQEVVNLQSAEVIVVIFLLANSLWNFFIYSARDAAFRKACRHFCGRLLRFEQDFLNLPITSY